MNSTTTFATDRTERVWAEQWRDHYRDVLRYAGSLLAGDTHAAEDVAQETGIRLWQHPEVLEDDKRITGWLHTVARNIVIDRSRRRGARPAEVALAPTLDVEGPERSGPADRIGAVASITATLSPLAPRHRVAIFEVYVRDRPVADVADDLGVPAGTVKSRCHYGLQQLRASA